MNNILNKLHKDHVNFIKLLEYLDEQHRLLKECENTDLELVLDAIWYMKEYPDFVHHPLENVIFEYFIQQKEESESISSLLDEHEEMPKLTNKLLAMLQAALADVPQERDELCAYLGKYIAVQKDHMNQEEASVYPLLESSLDDKDWQQIDSKLARIEDPLFGPKAEKAYQSLLQYVVG